MGLEKGAFLQSLTKNNKDLKRDRALVLVESAELLAKRTVEDIQVKIKQLERDMENMLDLSPDNVFMIKMPSDFDAQEFVNKRLDLALKIRNEKIKLMEAQNIYDRDFVDSTIPRIDITKVEEVK